jgi:hypothetical protein
MCRVVAAVVPFAIAAPIAGCVIVDPGPYYGRPSPRWCYYHPGRCY